MAHVPGLSVQARNGLLIWPLLGKYPLRVNVRVQRLLQEGRDAAVQQAFADMLLLAVGDGRVGSPMRIPVDLCAAIEDPHNLVHTIFGDLHGDFTARTTQHLTTRALLTPRNEVVNYLNDTCMAAFPGE